jgi:hypothetical protein
MKPTKESYLYTKTLFFCTQKYLSLPFSPSHLIIPLLLHSSLPHSSNATYAYNGLGIISFHKDGVLTGSRMLCLKSGLVASQTSAWGCMEMRHPGYANSKGRFITSSFHYFATYTLMFAMIFTSSERRY